jgi:hypothetical protein
MHVEISTLGHRRQKSLELKWILLCGIEDANGSLLGTRQATKRLRFRGSGSLCIAGRKQANG